MRKNAKTQLFLKSNCIVLNKRSREKGMNPRRIGLLASVAMAALALSAMLAPAAFGDTPKEGYERFAGCPSLEENEEVFLCQRSVIHGGHFQMGSKDVPITNPIIFSGGFNLEGEVFYTSKGGITPAKQPVPGGIVGLTGLDWLVDLLNVEQLKLYATTELAGTAFLGGGGTEVELPIKVHLENTVLGKNCYVGSDKNPIKLKLTTGTTSPPGPNKPITGKEATQAESDLEEVLLLEDGVFVDNAFAAPAASGCVLNVGIIPINIDAVVNLQAGLPSAAGTNETKQDFDLEVVSPETVYPPAP